jgi:hypothetical protein
MFMADPNYVKSLPQYGEGGMIIATACLERQIYEKSPVTPPEVGFWEVSL